MSLRPGWLKRQLGGRAKADLAVFGAPIVEYTTRETELLSVEPDGYLGDVASGPPVGYMLSTTLLCSGIAAVASPVPYAVQEAELRDLRQRLAAAERAVAEALAPEPQPAPGPRAIDLTGKLVLT